jgi:RimJ/RimL family protein N-acetyltransferase
MTAEPSERLDEFATTRLTVRDAEADDLADLLAVYLSNPAYLALTEGSHGEPGRYDRGMLERDFVMAQMTPGRHMMSILAKPGPSAIGVLDWMECNPSDSHPWIGLVMIHAERQHEGLGSEAVEGLLGCLRRRGVPAVRAAVIERNPAGRALVAALGFVPVSQKTMRMAAAEEAVAVVERSLEGAV